MKKSKKILSVLLAGVMTASLATAFTGCTGGEKAKTIAVIAKGKSHAFWQSVKAGAEAAGKKYGYTVTFDGPQSESAADLPKQKEMVTTALTQNPSGIVLATIGEGFVDSLTRAKNEEIPVVQFDSGIWAKDVEALGDNNPIVSSVATSNRLAAALAAQEFYKVIKPDIEKADSYVIGIIQHDETQTGVDRAGGFRDKMNELLKADGLDGKAKIELEVKPDDTNQAYKAALEALQTKKANAIYMCNEGVVKQVKDAIDAAPGKYDAIKFCGFDAGTKQIEWMKATSGPKLVGSVAQDSFQIGYQAVEQAIFAVEGKAELKDKVEIAGAWWNAENVDQMMADNLVYEG